MTTVVNAHWTSSAVSASYATATDWTPTGVPTLSSTTEFDVYIGGSYSSGTANFTVTSASNEHVGYLYIGSNATLAISGGQFQVDSTVQTHSDMTNYGKVTIASGSSLSFGAIGSPSADAADLDNVGSITVAGSLLVAAPYFELDGAGTLSLTGVIAGADTGKISVFKNENSTIQGSGALGNGQFLQLTNAYSGVINANTSALMTINTGAQTIYNEGTIETTGSGGLNIISAMQLDGVLEATGAGALTLTGVTVNGGGQVMVGASGKLVLNNGQLNLGGVVTIAKGGVLTTTAGNTTGVSTSDALAGDVSDAGDMEVVGTIDIVNDSTLNLNASVYNTGVIDMLGATGPTKLEAYNGGLTIDNTGGVVMSNSSDNAIVANGAASQLSLYTLISGAGTIGDGWLRVVSLVGSTIRANDATALTILADASGVSAGTESENFNGGTIINTGAGGIVLSGGGFNNSGYLTEDGTGVLTLDDVSINGGGGIVRALAGKIALEGNSQIYNQEYVGINSGATLGTTAGDTSDEIFAFVFNNGSVNVTAGSTLITDSHWTNASAINVGNTSASATIEVAAGDTWELLSAGTVHMLNASDKIVSQGAGTKFEDKSNLISGGGTIGDASMTVEIEDGAKVDATLAGGITLNATAEDSSDNTSLYNAGVIQSDSSVTLAAGIYSPGRLIVDSGAKLVADFDVFGAGSTIINGTGTAEFKGELDNAVTFGATAGGSLILDDSAKFYGAIFGLKAGDSIDLRDFAFVSGKSKEDTSTSSFGQDGGVLYVTNGASDSAPLYLWGNFTAATLAADHLAFQFASDGHVISGATDGTLVKLVSTS